MTRAIEDMTLDQLQDALTAWLDDVDNRQIVAAVTLLQDHDGWLRRGDFRKSCLFPYGSGACIRWSAVREYVDAGVQASTSELAVLTFALQLATDAFHWSNMGPAHRDMFRRAVTTALGER